MRVGRQCRNPSSGVLVLRKAGLWLVHRQMYPNRRLRLSSLSQYLESSSLQRHIVRGRSPRNFISLSYNHGPLLSREISEISECLDASSPNVGWVSADQNARSASFCLPSPTSWCRCKPSWVWTKVCPANGKSSLLLQRQRLSHDEEWTVSGANRQSHHGGCCFVPGDESELLSTQNWCSGRDQARSTSRMRWLVWWFCHHQGAASRPDQGTIMNPSTMTKDELLTCCPTVLTFSFRDELWRTWRHFWRPFLVGWPFCHSGMCCCWYHEDYLVPGTIRRSCSSIGTKRPGHGHRRSPPSSKFRQPI